VSTKHSDISPDVSKLKRT